MAAQKAKKDDGGGDDGGDDAKIRATWDNNNAITKIRVAKILINGAVVSIM